MKLKKIIKNIFNCCFHSPAKDVAAKGFFSDSISVEVDWFLVNQKEKRSCTTSGDCIASRLAKEVASQTNRTADYDCSGLANRAEVDWPSLFDIVNQKGRRAFFVPLDKIQQKKDLCENCVSLIFSNDTDFSRRGWYCWRDKWDNRGESENPAHLPHGKGLHSSCKCFSAVLRDE